MSYGFCRKGRKGTYHIKAVLPAQLYTPGPVVHLHLLVQLLKLEALVQDGVPHGPAADVLLVPTPVNLVRVHLVVKHGIIRC